MEQIETEPHPAAASETTSRAEQRTGFIYAILGVLLFGTSAVLVGKAAPIGPIEIAFERLVIATLCIAGLRRFTASGRGTPTGIRRQDLPRLLAIGLVAALHFALYILSLEFTTAAHTLTIVYTSPVFVTLGSAIFLKEPVRPRKWFGIIIVAIGVGILAGFEADFSLKKLAGDLLAFGSALAYAVYSLAGRAARHRYSLLGYTLAVYGFAVVWLLPLVLYSFASGPGLAAYSLLPLLAVIALGVGPLAAGHTLYNAALRRIHATYANVITTQEVTLGVGLAWLFLGQPLELNSLIGVTVALVGTLLVLI